MKLMSGRFSIHSLLIDEIFKYIVKILSCPDLVSVFACECGPTSTKTWPNLFNQVDGECVSELFQGQSYFHSLILRRGSSKATADFPSSSNVGGGEQVLVAKDGFLNLLRLNQGMDNLTTLF